MFFKQCAHSLNHSSTHIPPRPHQTMLRGSTRRLTIWLLSILYREEMGPDSITAITLSQHVFQWLQVQNREIFVTVQHKPPVKSGPGQFYFIADSDRTYLQLWIDNCFKFIRHPEVDLRFFEAWHVRIRKTEKTCLKVFILYTFPVQLHLENVSFRYFGVEMKADNLQEVLRKIWTFQIR